MSRFRFMLLLLALVLFGFAAIGYSQDVTEEPPTEPFFADPLFLTLLIAVVAFVILAVIIWFVFRTVKQWRAMRLSTQVFLAEMNRVKQELTVRSDSIEKISIDSANKLKKLEPEQTSIQNEQKNLQNSLSKLGNRLDGLELTLANMGPDGVPDKTVDIEAIIQDAQTQVVSLAQVYENGEPIDFIEIDNPTPSEKVVVILNRIARTLEHWRIELEQSGTVTPDLIQTLEFANQAIKEKLKEVRGPAPPFPEPPDPDTDVSTEVAYNEFKNKCTAYVAWYEGLLVGYQVGRQTAETDYNQFIPQFIKDRLFNGVARFVKFDQLPKQIDEFLQIVGYEVVPIEIGKTQADSRVHDIQSSRQTNAKSGTIVEVVLPGLQRKTDGEIVQKPVVIRGE